jgi:hypothetical protein
VRSDGVAQPFFYARGRVVTMAAPDINHELKVNYLLDLLSFGSVI